MPLPPKPPPFVDEVLHAPEPVGDVPKVPVDVPGVPIDRPDGPPDAPDVPVDVPDVPVPLPVSEPVTLSTSEPVDAPEEPREAAEVAKVAEALKETPAPDVTPDVPPDAPEVPVERVVVEASGAVRPPAPEQPAESAPPTVACVDSNTRCADWAKGGECTRNPQFRRSSCRQSCDLCGE